MATKTFSYYCTAKKMVNHQHNILFLRNCKRLKLIPNGLRATNVLAHTTNSTLAERLMMKHSKQWLQLALGTQYYNLSKIRSTVFPLSEKEDQQLERVARSLADKREHKIQSLLKQQCKTTTNHPIPNRKALKTYQPLLWMLI
jgi:hypothetical protein